METACQAVQHLAVQQASQAVQHQAVPPADVAYPKALLRLLLLLGASQLAEGNLPLLLLLQVERPSHQMLVPAAAAADREAVLQAGSCAVVHLQDLQ
jgi:hypothetical protein